MDVLCAICLNVLISEKDDHNLEFDFNYFCVNNICEICVKLEDGYVSGFLLPANIVLGFILKFLKKDYQIFIAISNFLVVFGLYHSPENYLHGV